MTLIAHFVGGPLEGTIRALEGTPTEYTVRTFSFAEFSSEDVTYERGGRIARSVGDVVFKNPEGGHFVFWPRGDQ